MTDMHDHHHHHHPHDHAGPDSGEPLDPSETMAEEPLDPANQSLSDALRLSFRVLKLVMVFLVIGFLVSGVVSVNQDEVVLLSRFGQLVGEPRGPGLHFAWPYPIDEQIRVSTRPRTLSIDAFWLRLSETDKTKSLSEVNARSGGLDPKVDGALLTNDMTGDFALMHLLLDVQYQVSNRVRVLAGTADSEQQVSDIVLFQTNVGDDKNLVRTVIQNAAVAEAARSTADVLWKNPGQLASAIQIRAQGIFDDLKTGIQLEKVAAVQSYFPLQARDEFLSVSDAENRRRQLVNEAEAQRTKKLLGVAGPAWEPLAEQIEKIDQAQDDNDRQEIIRRINEILANQATGEAGGRIKLAERDREKIIAETRAEVSRFEAYLPEYRKGPDLIRKQLRTAALKNVFEDPDVSKWLLPPGDKQLIMSLSKDPKEIREAEQRRLKEKTEKK